MLFRAIALAIVLPAAFAYWITDVGPPERKPADARAVGSSTQAPRAASAFQVTPVPASRPEAFAFSPANPFGTATGARPPASPPVQSQPQQLPPQLQPQPQTASIPLTTVASDSETSSGN